MLFTGMWYHVMWQKFTYIFKNLLPFAVFFMVRCHSALSLQFKNQISVVGRFNMYTSINEAKLSWNLNLLKYYGYTPYYRHGKCGTDLQQFRKIFFSCVCHRRNSKCLQWGGCVYCLFSLLITSNFVFFFSFMLWNLVIVMNVWL
jgi:hypothetical protein